MKRAALILALGLSLGSSTFAQTFEDYFVDKTKKAFCKERLISFLQEKGIALFDTASAIRRLQDNASDKFLEVVQPTDVPALLHRIPQCKAIVTTG